MIKNITSIFVSKFYHLKIKINKLFYLFILKVIKVQNILISKFNFLKEQKMIQFGETIQKNICQKNL